MIIRFDHAILAVGSLPSTVERLRSRYGFDAYYGGKHSGLGTENAMVRFGLDYIEVLGVYDRDEVVAAGVKRASLLDYIDNAGGGWLAFAMATNDIRSLARRFREAGLQAYGPYKMQRVRPDGVVLKWQLLVPERSAWRKPWPFFIQWEMPDDERLAVEIPGSHAVGKGKVCGVCIIVRDIEAAKYLYAEQLGFEYAGQGECKIPDVESAHIRLGDFQVDLITPVADGLVQRHLDARGEGLLEVTISVEDAGAAARIWADKTTANAHWHDTTIDLMPIDGGLSRARLSVQAPSE